MAYFLKVSYAPAIALAYFLKPPTFSFEAVGVFLFS